MLKERGLTLANFLIKAAVEHHRKTGIPVIGFSVPKASFKALQSDPDVNHTKCVRTLELEGFSIVGSDFRPMCLYQDDEKATRVALL